MDLLVALALVLVVAAGLAGGIRQAGHTLTALPPASDLTQRVRALRSALERDVAMAGAGPTRLADAAPMAARIPAIWPRRITGASADPDTAVFADRLTMLSVPAGAPEAPVAAMSTTTEPIALQPGAWCGTDPSCGFRRDTTVLLVDPVGTLEIVQEIWPGLHTLQPSAPLFIRFGAGTVAMGSTIVSYRFDAPRRQIRRALASGWEQPFLDDVVGFRVEYLGDPFPPLEPRPPAGDETCLFDRDGRSRLPVLAPTEGALAAIPPASLGDGPWCGAAPFRFDADLYRIRRVRIRVRLQADAADVRGRDPIRFRVAGRAVASAAEVPDLEVVHELAPRNLQRP